jgi:hypothetical protein
MVHVRTVSWMHGNGSGTPTSAVWIVGELDPQLRHKAPWTNGGSAEITLRPIGGGTPLSRKVDLSNTRPAVEFEFVTADAKLAPGVYSVQLELMARDGEPVGDFMRVTVPGEPTPLGEPVLSRRSNSPGQQYTRTADLRFRKTESVRFELPTTSAEPVDRGRCPDGAARRRLLRYGSETRQRDARDGVPRRPVRHFHPAGGR